MHTPEGTGVTGQETAALAWRVEVLRLEKPPALQLLPVMC